MVDLIVGANEHFSIAVIQTSSIARKASLVPS